MKELRNIPMQAVRPDPEQPRKDFDQSALGELVKSIRCQGLLQPISVRENNGAYIIICGERRYRAMEMLGEETIPAIIHSVSEKEAKELQLLENIVRQDMNPMEVANAYQSFLDKGYSLDQVSAITGKPKNTISWQLNLLNVRPDVQHLISRGQVSVLVGISLGRLSPNGQTKALAIMHRESLTLDQTQKLCARLHAEENAIEMFPETKMDGDTASVRRMAKDAFTKACQAIGQLMQAEDRNPGSVGEALSGDLAVTEEKVDELMRNLRMLKSSMATRKVAMLV